MLTLPMPMLDIALLGPPELRLGGEPLILRPRNSIKAKAILFYLAAAGMAVARERLAGLLWSDWPEKRARDYLRGEIFLLAPLRDTHWQEVDGRLLLRTEAVNVDWTHFRQALADPAATPETLAAALQLQRGPFLDGLETGLESSGELYIEWLQGMRTQVENDVRRMLYRTAEASAQTQRRLDLGIAAAERLLALEPEREEVHRLKMRLLALDGQRSAALKQYDDCTAALLDELGIPPAAETNALYDQIVSGEIGPAAVQAPTIVAPPYQALAHPVHFTGRTAEVEQLSTLLTHPHQGQVVAVVGMGGVGKTALAAQVADRLRLRFSDGVLWASVGANDPLDILQSWAQAFDKDLSKIGAVEARAAAMRNLLVGKQTLIVLDGATANRPLDPLLPGPGRCPVLITTRDHALVAAYTTTILELAELPLHESIEMLSSFLGAATVQREAAAAEALCQTLGGLPLAVELAAQRIFAMPRRSLERMALSLRDASNRMAHGLSHRTVRTSFEVSWEALPSDLRTVFALLGLFAGRSLPTAAVAQIAQIPIEQAMDALDQLVTLSLLKPDGAERYMQHQLLADFAHEKFAALPEPEAAALRFVAFYGALAKAAGHEFDRLEAEWANLNAALQMAADLQAWSILIETLDALEAPWFARARFTQAREGFRLGLVAADAIGDAIRKARYAYFLGKISLRQDEYAQARTMLGEAIGGFSAAQDDLRTADAFVDLADVAIEEGDFQLATADLEQAERHYRTLDRAVGLAAVRNRQALIAFSGKSYDTAAHLCIEGLAALTAGDGDLVRSRMLRLLADIAIVRKNTELASDFFRQAYAASHQLNDQTETAAILYAQAKLDHALGHEKEARGSVLRSIEIYTAMGDRKASAMTHILLSRIERALGNIAAALAAADIALALATEVHDEQLVQLSLRLFSAQAAAGE